MKNRLKKGKQGETITTMLHDSEKMTQNMHLELGILKF